MTPAMKRFPISQCAFDAINNKSVTVYSRSHDAVIRVHDEAGKCDRHARAHGRFQKTGWPIGRIGHARVEWADAGY
jgi:hypothetical protein